MLERDERPLAEIQFAMEVQGLDTRANASQAVRAAFAICGVKVAQDIIELGCTGLVLQLRHDAATGLQSPGDLEWTRKAVQTATFVRQHMAGSICGLPCYVPPDRFCLVHNIPGALQLHGNMDGPQLARHPEGIPLCSRGLTDDERKAQGKILNKITGDAADEAKALGGEVVEGGQEITLPPLPKSEFKINVVSPFKCSDHTEFNPKCRFCLAQAVAEGPLEPELEVFTTKGGCSLGDNYAVSMNADLPQLLADPTVNKLRAYVLAARWVRKLTRE
jgi:hypothetical protein